MPMIKLDGQDYDFDTLPENVKKQLQSLQFVDAELIRLENQIAVFKTAKNAYMNAIKQTLKAAVVPNEIPASGIMAGDTIKFD